MCSSSGVNSIINLNVGGKVFTTSLSTLLSEPGTSLLAKMFDPDGTVGESGLVAPAAKDREGNYFVDRNPAVFEVILEYLRTRELFDWPQIDRKRIRLEGKGWFKFHLNDNFARFMSRKEADYFGLMSLVNLIDEGIGSSTKQLVIVDVELRWETNTFGYIVTG